MRVVKYILLSIYVVLAIFVTFCLFASNKFGDVSFSNKIILGINSDISDFKAGSLLISTKNIKNVDVDDTILYYDTVDNKNRVSSTKVLDVMKTNDNEYTYVISSSFYLSSEYLIGEVDDITAIPFIGYIFNIFTNRLGYFILIIIPIIIAFIYQLKRYKGLKKKKRLKLEKYLNLRR